MTRDAAIGRATEHFDSGRFREVLARRVAMPTESQNPERAPVLREYLEGEMRPALEALGFTCRILEQGKWPFLFAERRDRWYGRGVVDNKGQHAINIAALQAVLETRGRLGFNAKYLIEMGEETGSPGLRQLCTEHKELFRSDVLIGSDGPRLTAERPTIFLGTRGGLNFDIWIDAREGGHHSGNWGGLLSDPATQLAHAIASIVGPSGQIRIPEWVPESVPDNVRRVLADVEIEGEEGGPVTDPTWGEPGLTGPEKVYAWSSFAV